MQLLIFVAGIHRLPLYVMYNLHPAYNKNTNQPTSTTTTTKNKHTKCGLPKLFALLPLTPPPLIDRQMKPRQIGCILGNFSLGPVIVAVIDSRDCDCWAIEITPTPHSCALHCVWALCRHYSDHSEDDDREHEEAVIGGRHQWGCGCEQSATRLKGQQQPRIKVRI